MELIRNIHNIKAEHQGCVLTIGNFDGVHLGHQQLIKRLLGVSRQLKLPSLAIIFEPQPNEFFAQGCSLRLMRFREKILAFQEQGLDRVLCIRFDDKMAKVTAEEFVRKLLFEKLDAKYVLVGDDFRFGYKRMGDFALLQQLGERYLFKTDRLPTFELLSERVSSTRIKQLLFQGNLDLAKQLLGQSFSFQGRVVQGDKRGRELGFPTANIYLGTKLIPISGVFVVEMLGITRQALRGVANVGTRPTVDTSLRQRLEVHLFDFDREIYGRRVKVRFFEQNP